MGTCVLFSNSDMGNGGYPLFSLKLLQQMLAVVQLLTLLLQVLEKFLQESWVQPLGKTERKMSVVPFLLAREKERTCPADLAALQHLSYPVLKLDACQPHLHMSVSLGTSCS